MTNSKTEIEEHCEQIDGQFRGGRFDPFIDFMEFPNYRSFQRGMRVSFKFPLTVIVGQNGTGKSSLLQALYGAPYGLQPGRWWFGTALDPMEDDELIRTGERKRLRTEDKAAFWYQYRSSGDTYQAVKMRVRREGDPDYWEPSRIIKSFGMNLKTNRKLPSDRDRDPQISVNAIYMNFKTQISAFDRCFYFNAPEAIRKVDQSAFWRDIKKEAKRRSARIQDYLRWRSHKLRDALVDGKTIKLGAHEFHNARVTLTPSELEDISAIIGRSYNSGFLLEHRFYETWGVSVMFNTDQRSYSDAFAGSGESAVVRLVHEITASEPGRLVLLDEPETSLHPGAQERLLAFLLREVAAKKLQVIISTHSPAIIRHLPKKAIRVMSLDANNRVCVQEDVNPDEAFFVLGHPPEDRIQLIVEDQLSKQFVEAVLQKTEDAFRSQFSCIYRPGGESAMKRDAAVFMQDRSVRRIFLFDGDQAKSAIGFDLTKIPITATAKDIDELIKSWLGVSVSFNQNSNMTEEQKIQLRKDFILYTQKCFRCFSFDTPEEAIWSDERAKQQLSVIGEESKFDAITKEPDFKKKFELLSRLTQPDGHLLQGTNIQTLHGTFIAGFCKDKGAAYTQTIDLLKGIASNA
jgi:predicted ATPase